MGGAGLGLGGGVVYGLVCVLDVMGDRSQSKGGGGGLFLTRYLPYLLHIGMWLGFVGVVVTGESVIVV